ISLMRAYSKASEIFGSQENAVKWLKTPNSVLGNITPVQALSSRFGAEEVMDMLGRIEYGVYS
nr:MbcA/ParS/Xre antitoxin family protein [Treponema sp.]